MWQSIDLLVYRSLNQSQQVKATASQVKASYKHFIIVRTHPCTVDPQMGSAAMKVKKQGCVNRSSLEHSMVIKLVRSEFESEAIWLLFYG